MEYRSIPEGCISTFSETYRNLRKYFLLNQYGGDLHFARLYDRAQQHFSDWLKENGAELIRDRNSNVLYGEDDLSVARGIDYIKIIDEEKFFWLLLKI